MWRTLFNSFLLLTLSGLFCSVGNGQMLDPVEWSFEKEELGEGEYRLHLRADLDQGWHLYSQNLPEDATPLPTVVEFEDNAEISLEGEVEEKGVGTEPDPISGNELSFFKGEGHFIQKLKAKGKTTLKGSVEYMVCDDERCLPPKVQEFSFELGAEDNGAEESVENAETEREGEEDEESEEDEEASSGMVDPVDWSMKAVQLEERRYALQLRAKIDEGWHLYATELEEGDGPLPTKVDFEAGEDQKLIGAFQEEEPLVEYDSNFQRDLSFHKGEAVYEQVLELEKGAQPGTAKATVEFMACDDERCTAPKTVELETGLSEAEKGELLLEESSEKGNDKEDSPTELGSDKGKGQKDERGLLLLFLLCFGGGFAALLTPCVFPMIPLTVSFFTKQSRTRAKGISNAITYSVSIILIYTALGYMITLIFGSDAMNAISTNPWMNLFFFAIILFFAISFLGGFDLNLPDSWVERSDKYADKGGMLGIFFMAFTLTLVSFSCTAPIIGPLLVQAASHGGIGPIVGMAGFSLALALPFGLFAGFPAWLNSLPQSGGWMNTVKVTLGFLELALAFKFLSNADLVVQAGLLKRELFIAIWIGIFGVMGLYLLGLFKTNHDGDVQRISVPRLLMATASIVFTLYLIPGLFGAPLQILSGFPPPKFYSEWSLGNDEGKEGCPLGLECYHDYEKGLAQAKKEGKPLMIDFTGWACVNCRKMEDNVWPKPQVYNKLRNEVVLVSLYVDERTELPEEEQRTVEVNGSKMKLRTVGNKWSYFQAKNYRTNTQPYYVLLDHDEEELVEPTGYEPDVSEFAGWLAEGIENFKEGG